MTTTHVIMIIDASGSMNRYRDETIDSFNAYLQSLKDDCIQSVRDEGPQRDYNIHLMFFNHRPTVAREGESVLTIPPLRPAQYQPMGMTALLDATGTAISKWADIAEEGDKVLVVSMTDGEENSSREFNLTTIRQLIETQQGKGWEFIYLAQGLDAWTSAQAMGYNRNTYVGTQAVDTGGTMRAMSHVTKAYAGGQSLNSTSTVNDWMEQESGIDNIRPVSD
jgi:hypothetical protein